MPENSSQTPFHKTLAREYAFKFLYHLQFQSNKDLEEVLTSSSEDQIYDQLKVLLKDFDESYSFPDTEHPHNTLHPETLDHARKLLACCLKNKEKIDEVIESSLVKRTLKRLEKIDLIILELGTCELLYFGNIPDKVTINEFVGVSKRFSGSTSYSFINGVLDRISKNEK